jgi:phosphatidylethanolamine/phosphatidyl-N-methylethanolamine N-methyltransferase
MQNATTVAKYRRLAPVYDALVGNRWVEDARRRAFALLPPFPAGARVLVVGVGTGADLPFLPRGARPIGVDLTDAMLARARRKTGSRLPLARVEAERLGLRDGSVDLVVLSLLLSVVERPRDALAEAVRVLRPGGLVLVFDKFAPDRAERISWFRRLLSRLTTAVGTDITRRLDQLLCGLPPDLVGVDCSLLGGLYRAALLRKGPVLARAASEAGR